MSGLSIGPGQSLVSVQAVRDMNEPLGDSSLCEYGWGTCSKGKRLTKLVTELELVVLSEGWAGSHIQMVQEAQMAQLRCCSGLKEDLSCDQKVLSGQIHAEECHAWDLAVVSCPSGVVPAAS